VFRQLSKEKANAIYEHGIARCFELIIYQEEQLFKETLAAAANIEKPVEPEGELPPDMQKAYLEAKKEYQQKMQQLVMACIKAKMVPPGVKGLIPDGDVTIQWRWLGTCIRRFYARYFEQFYCCS